MVNSLYCTLYSTAWSELHPFGITVLTLHGVDRVCGVVVEVLGVEMEPILLVQLLPVRSSQPSSHHYI